MPARDRRNFLKKAAASAGLVVGPTVRPSWGQSGPNDRINVAVTGIRGRGRAHYRELAAMPNVRVTHLCDIDERLFERGVREVEEISGHRPATVVDFRKLIEEKDLDAVTVATPDHWHALHTIWGCQAGKDVYVEKPACYTIREGRRMVQAAWKYGRMVQVGLQRRSDRRVRSVVRYVQEGRFGPAYRAKALVIRGRVSIGKVQESSVPEGVNWDLFLGPAPYTAFTLNRFHYGWHYFWDTSTTEIGNNGVHMLDVVRWGLNKQVHPVKIHCAGGLYVDDSDQEVPNTAYATFQYADGTLVELEMTTLFAPPVGGVRVGNIFHTAKGYISSEDNWSTVAGEFTPRDDEDQETGVSLRAVSVSFPKIAYGPGPSIPDLDEPEESHFENFVKCVRSRKREDLNCEVLEGHMSTALCHLANISLRTGRQLTFDPATETFPGDKEANELLTRKYREPYVLPEPV